MPVEVYLVKVGMTMTEGVIEQWYIEDGATVEQGQLLYALETEKVNLDVDAEVTGVSGVFCGLHHQILLRAVGAITCRAVP